MLLYILLAAQLAQLSSAFPNGASEASCGLLAKYHRSAPQTATPPFKVVLDRTSYCDNGLVGVNITSAGVVPIGGIRLQIRSEDNTVVVPVTWEKIPAELKIITCAGTLNTLTHQWPMAALAVWGTFRMPKDFTGSINIAVAISADYDVYWPNVVSSNTAVPTSAVCPQKEPLVGPRSIDPFISFMDTLGFQMHDLNKKVDMLEKKIDGQDGSPAPPLTGAAVGQGAIFALFAVTKILLFE